RLGTQRVSAMIPALQARDVGREYLDQPTIDADELHRNLREMAMLNRLPGGVGASRRAIEWLLDGAGAMVVLDVGTGSGDLPAALARHHSPRALHVLACDLRADVLEYATRRLARVAHVQLLEADARRLPPADESVDVAQSSLLLH